MKISKLEKRSGEFHLFIESLILKQGIIHGIIGANGCGKSTLAKLLAGLIVPDSGEIDLGDLSARDITMASQRPYLLHDTVYNNLIYPLKVRGEKIDKNKVSDWLELMGLDDKRDQYAPGLSSGERQKLSIGRAMIFEPKLIIIDEAMSNLDPEGLALFEGLFHKRQRENPATWIIISHQLAHIGRMCDIVHFMQKGNIIESGTCQNILIDPSNEVLQEYVRRERL